MNKEKQYTLQEVADHLEEGIDNMKALLKKADTVIILKGSQHTAIKKVFEDWLLGFSKKDLTAGMNNQVEDVINELKEIFEVNP